MWPTATTTNIVLDSGSTGGTLAVRLREDPSVSMLLLEAGPAKGTLLNNWRVDMLAAFGSTWQSPAFNWMFEGKNETTLNDRSIIQPRGKMLGVSSSSNIMCFIRGHALDFERWVTEGADDWSWREVLSYLKRMETWQSGESAWRSGPGQVHVIQGDYPADLHEAFIQSGEQAGYAVTDDINGQHHEGFGAFQMNIYNGMRTSTAEVCVRFNAGRANLTVETDALATKVALVGTRTAGLEIRKGNGQAHTMRATRELILSGGAVGSPHLVMLWGISPADELRQHGIDVKVDLPGVGQNLHDHPLIYMKWRTDKSVSMSKYMRKDLMLCKGARWLSIHTGPGAANNVERHAVGCAPTPPIRRAFIPASWLPRATSSEWRTPSKWGVRSPTSLPIWCMASPRSIPAPIS
ncbi:MAG: GMC family oxidoreductase N-terminal domain-containing protein [Rhodospirillales bacterium]|nr:GMC family oxidoreductase N-terminal domain-containing protein [Rhodospirillales bacterium]